MTPDMVRLAIGLPDSIKRDGQEETWGYAVFENDYQPMKKYVYFVYFDQGWSQKPPETRTCSRP